MKWEKPSDNISVYARLCENKLQQTPAPLKTTHNVHPFFQQKHNFGALKILLRYQIFYVIQKTRNIRNIPETK